MESKIKETNKKILEVTLYIKNNCPELSKYVDEMPVTIPNDENPEINLKSLEDYLNTLNELINTYEKESLIKHSQN